VHYRTYAALPCLLEFSKMQKIFPRACFSEVFLSCLTAWKSRTI
jgi:hypothetical protein